MIGIADGAWVLNQPLKVLSSEDHPYLETALGTLGSHEVAVHLTPGSPEHSVSPEFRIFLDGAEIFELGDLSPSRPWFQLCRELGYAPELHWDWDPALILFRQVVPALAQGWHEVDLPYGQDGVPEGVVCLETLRRAYQERALLLSRRGEEGARQAAAELFSRLPLRAVTFHDDPERRVDYLGNPMDTPYLGEYLHFGVERGRAVVVSRMTLLGTGGMKWSPWLPGGAWSAEGREFRSTLGAQSFLEAAGIRGQAPPGFGEAFRQVLDQLCTFLEGKVEAYRQAIPAGVPWHRDPKSRYLNRMIVDVRLGEDTVLVLDDGSEIVVAEVREAALPR